MDKLTLLFYYKICSYGSYLLYAYADSNSDGQILIRGNKPDPDIKGLGQYNTIAVVANGNSITMYVNSHAVGSVLNSLNPGGQLALFAKDEGHSTQVAFSNARVWTLQ